MKGLLPPACLRRSAEHQARAQKSVTTRLKKLKPVVYFRGKEKGLVLNKTNANKITTLLGSDDTDNWEGRQIRLYATEVRFGGETMEGIRVKAATQAVPMRQPEKKPPTPPPGSEFEGGPTDDEIPF